MAIVERLWEKKTRREKELSPSAESTSRVLVYRTLEFASPSRIPRQLFSPPGIEKKWKNALQHIRSKYPDDLVLAPVFYLSPETSPLKPVGRNLYRDEWGCLWERPAPYYLGKVKEAPLKDLSLISGYRPPESILKIDREAVRSFCRRTECFVLSGVEVRLFERLQALRGEMELFQDLVHLPGEFMALLKLVHEFNLKLIDVWSSTSVDGLVLVDDWGSQNRLLISPRLWRRLFKPLYREYVELIHSRSKKVFFHSDGYILEIIPDLVAIGIDALNAQLFTLGLNKLQEIARGKLTFWGCADVEFFQVAKTKVEITRRVKALKEKLSFQGGIIARVDFVPGVETENIINFLAAWERF